MLVWAVFFGQPRDAGHLGKMFSLENHWMKNSPGWQVMRNNFSIWAALKLRGACWCLENCPCFRPWMEIIGFFDTKLKCIILFYFFSGPYFGDICKCVFFWSLGLEELLKDKKPKSHRLWPCMEPSRSNPSLDSLLCGLLKARGTQVLGSSPVVLVFFHFFFKYFLFKWRELVWACNVLQMKGVVFSFSVCCSK